MNLLDIASIGGRTYKKAGTTHGGEWQGPCPTCGGTDRFHIWPHQGEHGTYWCRSCDQAGDAIQYLMQIEGKSFPEAARHLGKELDRHDEFSAPVLRRPHGTGGGTYTPRETTPAANVWATHAEKFAMACHDHLLNTSDQMAWLQRRGLDRDAVAKYRLGWNAADTYRAREAWGLPPALKDDGKPKKLWLPQGITIPYYFHDSHEPHGIQRLRIRRPEGEPRYYLVPGSNTAPMVLLPSAKRPVPRAMAFVIVESELDALLLHHLAGDLVGAISQGNSTAKPDSVAAAELSRSSVILVALDSDEPGMRASVWWRKQYPQAERWPVPVGKDPGEAFQSGVDIRAWLLEGLPPVFHVAAKPSASYVPVGPAPITPPPNRAELIVELYDHVNSVMPDGAMAWLATERTDIITKIRRQEADLDRACDGYGDFAKNLDLVRRMWLRAWDVYREACRPEPPPPVEPPPQHEQIPLL